MQLESLLSRTVRVRQQLNLTGDTAVLFYIVLQFLESRSAAHVQIL